MTYFKGLTYKIAAIIFFSLTIQWNPLYGQINLNGFSFQGYARNLDGAALSNEEIEVRLNISKGGSEEFTEVHEGIITDIFGVFSLTIGSIGTAQFRDLDFTNNTDYTLKVETRVTGGTWATISNAPLRSVPYAQAASNGVPTGAIMPYMGTTAPDGWVLCDGSSLGAINGSDALELLLGSANVPDLRGMFIRGAGTNAYNTVTTAIAVAYDENIKSHNHDVTDPGHDHSYNDIYHSEANGTISVPSNVGSGDSDGDNKGLEIPRTTGVKTTGVSVDNTGGDETSPVHYGVNYIIKL